MFRFIKRLFILVLVVVCVIFVVNACSSNSATSSSGNVKTTASTSLFKDGTDAEVGFVEEDSDVDGIYVEFMSKVDGDTAWFHDPTSNSDMKVRFLGIDTPETVKEGVEVQAWGPEASEYTTTRLSNAYTIYLQWDPNSDREDAYGRTLAWVWVDGGLLEEELVSLGYAQVAYIYGDYLYTDRLYAAQERAQNDCIGMWSDTSYMVG